MGSFIPSSQGGTNFELIKAFREMEAGKPEMMARKQEEFPFDFHEIVDIAVGFPNFIPTHEEMSGEKTFIYKRLDEFRRNPEEGVSAILQREGYHADPKLLEKIVKLAERMTEKLKEKDLANKAATSLKSQESKLVKHILECRTSAIRETCEEIDTFFKEMEEKHGLVVANQVMDELVLHFVHDISRGSFELTEQIKNRFNNRAEEVIKQVQEKREELTHHIQERLFEPQAPQTKKEEPASTGGIVHRPLGQAGRRRPTHGVKAGEKTTKEPVEDKKLAPDSPPAAHKENTPPEARKTAPPETKKAPPPIEREEPTATSTGKKLPPGARMMPGMMPAFNPTNVKLKKRDETK